MATMRTKAAAKKAAAKRAAAKKAAPAVAQRLADLERRAAVQDAVNAMLAALVRAQLSTMPSEQRDEAEALLAVIGA